MLTKTPIEPNAIYTREETAHILGISLSTLKQLIRTGQLRVSQPVGLRRVFIRGNCILEMLDASARDSRTDTQPANGNGHSKVKTLRAKQISARTQTPTSKKYARVAGGANR